MQRFLAVEPFTFNNGAIGWRPGGPMDCVGPFAKVERCPIDDAEEWAVHDTDGLPDLGEWPDLDQLAQIAEGIEDHGNAYRGYLACFDADETSADDFQERYLGEHRNPKTSPQTGWNKPADSPMCPSTCRPTSTSTPSAAT